MKVIPVYPFAKQVMTNDSKYDDILATAGD
ncbi:hypothetical protein ETI10_01145 [Macrococcoides goetzii]|nr:hypothetical protein ETI10_01145 [Macrococcus goetzii]